MIISFFNYLEFEKRYSSHTLDAYKSDIEQFTSFLQYNFQVDSLVDVTSAQVRSWMVSLKEQNISNRSINRKLSALKTLFNFLRSRHGLAQNPLRKIISPKTEKRLPLTVRKEHLERMFLINNQNAGDTSYILLRNDLVLDMLYSCGLRRSELMQLSLKDLDLDRRLCRVLGKGKKERWVPLSAHLVDKILTYLIFRHQTLIDLAKPEHFYLFMTDQCEPLYPKWVYNLVKKNLSLVSSVERRSPHILRHSFATHLSDAGADLHVIKTLLGHSSLAATQVYMHNSIEKLKKIYDQAHPKS
ncbi:MAG: tyrosine-type recombinase/integrase [Saprospiraceae bacterium]|nr:tyrosine-type recombinase/integrase [Saprospiraceae bacterium]MBL0111654.1 tyrosine-type recombinase/integrase [Saprospiraceae bacterium]